MNSEAIFIPTLRTRRHQSSVAGDHLHRMFLLERLNKNLYRPAAVGH